MHFSLFSNSYFVNNIFHFNTDTADTNSTILRTSHVTSCLNSLHVLRRNDSEECRYVIKKILSHRTFISKGKKRVAVVIMRLQGCTVKTLTFLARFDSFWPFSRTEEKQLCWRVFKKGLCHILFFHQFKMNEYSKN